MVRKPKHESESKKNAIKKADETREHRKMT